MKRLFQSVGFYLLVAAIVLYAVFPFYYAIVTLVQDRSGIVQRRLFPVELELG